jgi:PhnB protein
MPNVKPVPEGSHTITPSLIVDDGLRALDFYKRAFGAIETMRMLTPDGKLSHGEIKIGDSLLMVSDASVYRMRSPRALGGTPVSLYMYVDNADAVFNQAVEAGAEPTMPVADMFWGDRCGVLVDPFGHQWSVATHTADLTPEQIERGAKEFHARMSGQAAQ